MNKILIISPHPDDEAIGSGGLIMLAKKKGWSVFVLYIALGTTRQFLTGQTLEKDRREEAKKAADLGGFEYDIAFDNVATKLDTFPQKFLIERIEDAIESFKPDTVVIPYRDSYNQDHRAVAQACVTALRPIPKELRHQADTILESEEPYSWPNAFTPNFYVDISEVFEDKIALYKCHASQVPKDPFPRSVENLERLAGIRGCDISAKYAEGYRLIRGQL